MKSTQQGWLNESLTDPKERLEFDTERACFEFVEQLQGVLDRLGITRAALAKRLSKSPSYITQVLNGSRNLTIATMTELASAVACEMHVRLRYRDPGSATGPVYVEAETPSRTEWTSPPAPHRVRHASSEALPPNLVVLKQSWTAALGDNTSPFEFEACN
jgi:transcriptional regulator with XRE-family HTH domain